MKSRAEKFLLGAFEIANEKDYPEMSQRLRDAQALIDEGVEREIDDKIAAKNDAQVDWEIADYMGEYWNGKD